MIDMESAIHRIKKKIRVGTFLQGAGVGDVQHLEDLEPGVIDAMNIKQVECVLFNVGLHNLHLDANICFFCVGASSANMYL